MSVVRRACGVVHMSRGMMNWNMGMRQRWYRTRAGTGAGTGPGTRAGAGTGTGTRARLRSLGRPRLESSESFRSLSSALLFSFVVLPVGIRVDFRVSTNRRSRRPVMIAVAGPHLRGKGMMRVTGAVRR